MKSSITHFKFGRRLLAIGCWLFLFVAVVHADLRDRLWALPVLGMALGECGCCAACPDGCAEVYTVSFHYILDCTACDGGSVEGDVELNLTRPSCDEGWYGLVTDSNDLQWEVEYGSFTGTPFALRIHLVTGSFDEETLRAENADCPNGDYADISIDNLDCIWCEGLAAVTNIKVE